jgi:hypothetical protein
VPVLDAATEALLIGRCHAVGSVAEKAPILRVLAFGGGDAAVTLFTNAILHEFRGYEATSEENGILLSLPFHLGFLARRNDRALEFLLEGIKPETDLSADLWRFGPANPSASVVRSICYDGLGISGRGEVKALLESILVGPEAARTSESDSSVMDCAFYNYLVDTFGFEAALMTMAETERSLKAYEEWREKTRNRQDWSLWYEQGRNYRRQNQDKSP